MKVLVIFVKEPIPGRVKTRLAVTLGVQKAALLSRVMAEDTLAVARQVPGTRLWVAYEGRRIRWLKCSHVFRQTGEHLGKRLIQAFAYAFGRGGGPIIVVGSDLPTF